MSNRTTPELLLTDIVESGEKILRYTLNMTYEEFISSEIIIDAVIRNFEVIGEAANRLPDEFKDKYEIIDWHRIRGFRNRIVHDYAGIDLQIVWRIKETFLLDMLSQIKEIIN
jgi:uncharacterized protein with HEPN domain